MIRTIIVDDEIKSRQTLFEILRKYCPEVSVVGEANNAADAYNTILELQPDFVFLDVSMPHENGFELLQRFNEIFFQVIFITAYEQYAIKAIKVCALDFLLKPLDIREVMDSVDKAKKNIILKKRNISLDQLLQNLDEKKISHNKIAIPTKSGLDFIAIGDIIRMEAESNYTLIFLPGNRKIVSTRHLKEYEDILPPDHFFRTHHSHIINLEHVTTYHKGDGGYVIMYDGSTVDIAKRKKREFLSLFET